MPIVVTVRSGVIRRVVIVVVLVLAAAMVWLSARYKGEPEQPSLTDAAVEQLVPARDTTVVRQSEIGVDLTPGWDADLRINGVDIPEDEERNVPGLNQVFFTPGKGKIIEALEPGLVEVTAIIWRPAQGETRESGSRTLRWSFHVA